MQKEQALGDAYNKDQAYKRASLGSSMSDTARGYQSKYGNTAAGGLSQYYNLGGNTYNPKVATGGVGSSGLSSIYNPSGQSYQGTEVVKNQGAIQTRTAKKLATMGNKLLSTGYNYQA